MFFNFVIVLIQILFEKGRGWEPIYRKSVLDALCLTHWNLAVSNWLSRTRQQWRSWVCSIRRLSYMHIGVGFGVARFDKQAMPEPLRVGRVTVRFPRLFYVWQQITENNQVLGDCLVFIWVLHLCYNGGQTDVYISMQKRQMYGTSLCKWLMICLDILETRKYMSKMSLLLQTYLP